MVEETVVGKYVMGVGVSVVGRHVMVVSVGVVLLAAM